jgi:hypothetical protein
MEEAVRAIWKLKNIDVENCMKCLCRDFSKFVSDVITWSQNNKSVSVPGRDELTAFCWYHVGESASTKMGFKTSDFCYKVLYYWQATMHKMNIFYSILVTWPQRSSFMLNYNLQYYIGHTFRDETFSTSAVLSVTTSQHFPTEVIRCNWLL